MNKKDLFALFKTSFKDWLADNAILRAAALTFFIILPLPSLLLIIVSIFALFYGQTQATQIVIQQITALAGPSVAELFSQLLSSSTSPFSSVWTAVTVVGFSLGGAIGAFAVLRDTMDVIWEVRPPKTRSLSARLSQRIGPFVLVSALGLIVIAWTGLTTSVFSAITLYSMSETLTLISVTITQIALSFGLSSLLLAITYKLIPQVKVHWKDVILPAVVTSIAFIVTNYVIGIYIQIFTVTTVIGAAGSLLIILLWIFILNQIVLFGAEVSKVFASTFGPHPKEHLPASVEKIVRSIETAGERIEQLTKGTVNETTKATLMPDAKEAPENRDSNREKRTKNK